MQIELPYLYTPREYQVPLWEAFDQGVKRLFPIWHRRAGKDKCCLNLVAREMAYEVGNYFYAFPTYEQARKAIWEGRGKDGVAYLDHFPKELVAGTHDQRMQVRYKNGSLLQLVGTEDVDKLVGTNPRGIIFSEWPLQNPKAWDYMRPILAENGGWAIFNGTPRGKNHAFKMKEMADAIMREDLKAGKIPRWWVQVLTVEDTGVLTPEDIEEERRAGMDEDMIQQEFYCSFVAAIQGSYYWKQVDEMERGGRVKDVPYDPKLLVHTVWDLGKNDYNCIGFYQSDGVSVRKIDYLDGGKKGLAEWIKEVQAKPYLYGKHFAPHDIEVSDYTLDGTTTRKEFALAHGIDFTVVPRIPVQDGIDTARRFFSKLVVDQTHCAKWLEAIPQYTQVYDEDRKTFRNTPLHDWTSNYADEHRYASIVHPEFTNEHQTATQADIQVARQNRINDARANAGA
ncbi:hypothetical protein [Bradyrhizobium elkanii]|uniref:hypothetical protein n=1 Tax=Bradyrhizobium elkanii TaxID=29448 RepID=UPI003D22B55D